MENTGARYYVYELTDPRDGSIFYVGKGSGRRIHIHALSVKRQDSRYKRHNPKLFNKISSILSDGETVVEMIVRRFHDEDEAYVFETRRILDIGLNNLCNILPGGKGGPSGDDNPSKRPEFREFMRSLWKNEAYRCQITEALSRFWNDPDNKKMMSERLKAIWTEEMRLAWSAAMSAMWDRLPERRAELAIRMRENNPSQTDEVRRKLSIAWTDDRREKFRAKISGLHHRSKTPETRAKIKASWTEQKRRNLSERIRATWTEERRAALGNRFRGTTGPKRKISVNDSLRIKDMYASGISRKILASTFDVSVTTIHKVIHGNFTDKPSRISIDASNIGAIQEMRENGASYREIALEFGTSVGAVRNFLKRHFGGII